MILIAVLHPPLKIYEQMKKSLLLSVLLVWIGFSFCNGQDIPKREMRAAWVTTVWGLDWPGYVITSTGDTYAINQQKDQMTDLLDQLKAANMNTIFFQVRSECDAMYQSSYEPWSSHLVSERGMDPGYDPLQFVIEEAHKRGMEIHAWLNPYRFESEVGKYEGEAGDYRDTHPEWVLEYDEGSSILDPGNPGVRQRITDIVEEIVSDYDVDGIVFDDYFYAYGGTPSDLDSYSQEQYKPEGMDLHDWRRDNVNQMVKDVYDKIQDVKPWVTFGVSPFGIWTTDESVAGAEGLELPEGITGMDAYHQIYCDPVAWLKEGTVDYVSPQLYWPTTSSGQDYEVLAPWWSDVTNQFRRHLYVSHTLSDLAESDYAPAFPGSDLKSTGTDGEPIDLNGLSMLEYFSQPDEGLLKGTLDPSEFGKQVQINRSSDKNGAPGSVFFRASMFYRTGFVNYLNDYEFSDMALPPAINWKDAPDRSVPNNLRIEGDSFKWDSPETGVRFSVYAIPNSMTGENGLFSTPEHLIGVSYQNSFDLSNHADLVDNHTFAVAVLDRYGNEFPPAMMGYSPSENQGPVLTYPENNQDVFNPFNFTWEEIAGAEFYILEVAEDQNFENIVYSREIGETQFDATNVSMEIGQDYYWRVSSRMIGVQDEVSEVRSFGLIAQPSPEILDPDNNSTGVSLTPEVQWEDFGEGFTYQLQVSQDSDFSSVVYEVNDVEELSHQVADKNLMAWTDYYLRVRASNAQTVSDWSPVVKITTLEETPEIPTILTPADNSSVDPGEIMLTIEEEPYAKGFNVQVSSQENFPWTDRQVHSMDAFQYETSLGEWEEGTYYLRVSADYASGSSTDWSEVVSFNVVPTSIAGPDADGLYLFCPSRLDDGQEVIEFALPRSGHARLFLSDITGRQVKLLKDAVVSGGEHTVTLSVNDLKKGLYFLTLKTPFGSKTLKLIR